MKGYMVKVNSKPTKKKKKKEKKKLNHQLFSSKYI